MEMEIGIGKKRTFADEFERGIAKELGISELVR